MIRTARTLCTLALAGAAMLLAPRPATAAEGDAPKAADSQGKKKVVFLAGGPSHGFGSHDHLAGCHLLARRINEVPGFTAVVHQGWPGDASLLEGAAAVILYSDGGGGHFAAKSIKELDALHEKGAGIGAIHYAVEVVKGEPGDHWLKWMGGYFETHWSVNPHWRAKFDAFAQHAVASGVQPFGTQDEWYYNMRFREGMEGVTPILSAVPPDKTREGKDGAHSGNPEVRKGVGKNQKEHVFWVSENKNGSRGFGTTGGHFHRNWVNDEWRQTVLNGIVWIAKGDVPKDGIASKRPDAAEMLSNHDKNELPEDESKRDAKKVQGLLKEIEQVNAEQDQAGGNAAKPQARRAGEELLFQVSAAK